MKLEVSKNKTKMSKQVICVFQVQLDRVIYLIRMNRGGARKFFKHAQIHMSPSSIGKDLKGIVINVIADLRIFRLSKCYINTSEVLRTCSCISCKFWEINDGI